MTMTDEDREAAMEELSLMLEKKNIGKTFNDGNGEHTYQQAAIIVNHAIECGYVPSEEAMELALTTVRLMFAEARADAALRSKRKTGDDGGDT